MGPLGYRADGAGEAGEGQHWLPEKGRPQRLGTENTGGHVGQEHACLVPLWLRRFLTTRDTAGVTKPECQPPPGQPAGVHATQQRCRRGRLSLSERSSGAQPWSGASSPGEAYLAESSTFHPSQLRLELFTHTHDLLFFVLQKRLWKYNNHANKTGLWG